LESPHQTVLGPVADTALASAGFWRLRRFLVGQPPGSLLSGNLDLSLLACLLDKRQQPIEVSSEAFARSRCSSALSCALIAMPADCHLRRAQIVVPCELHREIARKASGVSTGGYSGYDEQLA